MSVEAHLRFCLSLHRRLDVGPQDTVCWSPFSVASALGMVAHLADDPARTELAELLTGSADQVPSLAEALRCSMDLAVPARHHPEPPAPRLATSNTLWTEADLPLVDNALGSRVAGWPTGGVRPMPFRAAPDDSRKTINRDVARETQGLVHDLLPPGSVTDRTVALLVNALYLRTSWTRPFPTVATVDADFASPDGPVPAAMMRLTARMRYARVRGWQAVDLPALGSVAATVLLPDQPLSVAEPKLDAELLGELTGDSARVAVDLTMPRTDVGARASLRNPVAALGAESLFGPDLRLPSLTTEPLTVSDVVHHARVRLDESGLEGAAATAVRVERSGVPHDRVAMTVDRPFLLMVRHQRTGMVFFLARVNRP